MAFLIFHYGYHKFNQKGLLCSFCVFVRIFSEGKSNSKEPGEAPVRWKRFYCPKTGQNCGRNKNKAKCGGEAMIVRKSIGKNIGNWRRERRFHEAFIINNFWKWLQSCLHTVLSNIMKSPASCLSLLIKYVIIANFPSTEYNYLQWKCFFLTFILNYIPLYQSYLTLTIKNNKVPSLYQWNI